MSKLLVNVRVFHSYRDFKRSNPFRSYIVDYSDRAQRAVLGTQCRNAMEAGQIVLTLPMNPKSEEV